MTRRFLAAGSFVFIALQFVSFDMTQTSIANPSSPFSSAVRPGQPSVAFSGRSAASRSLSLPMQSAGTDQVHFGKKTPDGIQAKFTQKECSQLADAIIRSEKVQTTAHHDEIAAAIEKGEKIPTEHNGFYRFGMLRKDGKGHYVPVTTDPEFAQIMKTILGTPEAAKFSFPQGKDEIPVAIKVHDDLSLKQLDEFAEIDLKQKTFLQEGIVPAAAVEEAEAGEDKAGKKDKKKEDLKVEVAPLLPFFRALLAPDEQLPEKTQHLEKKLLNDIPIYDIICPDSPELEDQMQQAFAPWRKTMAALSLMGEHYVHSVNRMLMAACVVSAGAIGAGGEIATDAFMPPHEVTMDNLLTGSSILEMTVRPAIIGFVDAFDNFLGSFMILKRKLKDAGKKVLPLKLYKSGTSASERTRNTVDNTVESGKSKLKKLGASKQGTEAQDATSEVSEKGDKPSLAWDGDNSHAWRETREAAQEGALAGTGVSILPNLLVLSHANMPDVANMAAGAVISTGTAMAIPPNVRKQDIATYVGIQSQIENGLIKVPEGMDREEYVRQMVGDDIFSQVEFAAQTKALPYVPAASGGIFGVELLTHLMGLHIPHDVFMQIFMFGAASMENILALLFADRAVRSVGKNMAEARMEALQSPHGGLKPEAVRDLLVDKQARAIGNTLAHPPVKKLDVQYPSLEQIRQFQPSTGEDE